jgi:YHS domain-containing protein
MAKVTSKAVKLTILGILVSVVPIAWAVAGGANKPIATDSFGVAIKGYDTVAYFTEGRALKGKKEFEFSWQSVRWYFANAAHRDLFAANPKRYVPQFGGFCARGMTRGKMAAADPKAWTIVDGKLYMKFSKASRDRWRQNKAENIKKAEEKWANIRKQN